LLAALLSIPTDRRPPPVFASGAKGKNDQVLVGTLSALPQPAGPAGVEDAHWVDPTSLETLDALVAQVATAAVLM
jgi:predicted ATPase